MKILKQKLQYYSQAVWNFCANQVKLLYFYKVIVPWEPNQGTGYVIMPQNKATFNWKKLWIFSQGEQVLFPSSSKQQKFKLAFQTLNFLNVSIKQTWRSQMWTLFNWSHRLHCLQQDWNENMTGCSLFVDPILCSLFGSLGCNKRHVSLSTEHAH